MKNWLRSFIVISSLLLSFVVHAQDMGELGSIACEGQGPECQENIVSEQDLKNPADKGTMKLVSAGASLLYMGGVLNGVLKLPAFMGDVAKICASSGLMVAANLLAFMNARGNGNKIKGELAAIKEEAKQLQEKLENEELRRSKEFQIEVFDFYMRAMERLQKITQLRIKQHGNNSSYYSIAMSVGIAEAIIYSLPWSSNPPMAKCGAKSAIFAGIALAMEKKGQSQANKLLEEYSKRWGILAQIKSRLMIGTQSLAKADGTIESGGRNGLNGDVSGESRQGLGRDWEAQDGGLSVSGREYGCVNSQEQMDPSCSCAASNTCFKSSTTGWNQSRYASAFSSAGLDGYISDMNSAFAGKNTDPSTLSMASINQKNASAARLRDRLLRDYVDKERNAKKKNRLGDKIGIASDRELAAFLNSNFKRSQLNDLFAKNSDVFAGSDQIDLGPTSASELADKKNFDKAVEAISSSANGAAAGATDSVDFGLGDEGASDQDLMAFDPKNIILPSDADYDYVGNREDIVRNNSASLFEIISHRYQLIYRQKPADL